MNFFDLLKQNRKISKNLHLIQVFLRQICMFNPPFVETVKLFSLDCIA